MTDVLFFLLGMLAPFILYLAALLVVWVENKIT